MPGERVGYVRVSTAEQNVDRQIADLRAGTTFVDHASGRDTQRPQLEAMLRFVRAGDRVIVHSMDRLARNLSDLLTIVEDLTGRGIRVEFVHEHLAFTGEDSPMASLMLSIMGAVAEFERALIRERQLEGIALAKARGVYRGGWRRLSEERIAELRRRTDAGEGKAALAREFGISRQTLYRYVNSEQRDPSRSEDEERTSGC